MTTAAAELSGVGLVSAVVLAIFGVPLQPIMYGFIGGVIGSSLAPPVKWWMSIAFYVSASLISALIGQVMADRYFQSNAICADVLAVAVAVFFHPILATASTHVPAVVNWGFRIFGPSQKP